MLLIVNVATVSGTPISGATVQILKSGIDVTIQVSATTVRTDTQGRAIFSFDTLPAFLFDLTGGNTFARCSASGYGAENVPISSWGDGQVYSALLTRAVRTVQVGTVPAIVSMQGPTTLTIATETSPDWQLIEATIQTSVGSSGIDVPIDESGNALVNIQGRLRLSPLFSFVPDTANATADTNLFTPVTVNLAITDAGGSTSVGTPISLTAVNIYPVADTTDLTTVVGKWLTPQSPMPVFRGYPSDCGIILSSSGSYDIEIRSSLNQVFTTLTFALNNSPALVRVKIPDVSNTNTLFISLLKSGTSVSDTLKINYV